MLRFSRKLLTIVVQCINGLIQSVTGLGISTLHAIVSCAVAGACISTLKVSTYPRTMIIHPQSCWIYCSGRKGWDAELLDCNIDDCGLLALQCHHIYHFPIYWSDVLANVYLFLIFCYYFAFTHPCSGSDKLSLWCFWRMLHWLLVLSLFHRTKWVILLNPCDTRRLSCYGV